MENMNFNSQLQNPTPLEVVEKHGHWTLATIVIVLSAFLFVTWWYVDQMDKAPLAQNQSASDQRAVEDAMLANEVGAIDAGNIDAEFQSIDQDLNSL